MVKQTVFTHKMKVRDYECDAQGHVNNANYQHYLEVTRHEFLEEHGLNFFFFYKQGIDAVVARVDIRYKTPLIGMDEFVCTIALERTGIKYVFHQEIVRLSDGKVCAKGKVEVVCLIDGKLSKPEIFDQAFEQFI